MKDEAKSEQARELRATLFNDYTPAEVFAEAVNKSTRTVNRMIREGLPVIRIGKTPHVIISKARVWLLNRESNGHLAPRRGRPRKAA